MNSKMTIKETLQNIAKMESDYFIEQLFAFDYSCLSIPHVEVLADYHLAYKDQMYKNFDNSGNHLFLYKMDIHQACDLVAYTMKAYQRQNNISFIYTYFKFILDKYPVQFVELLNKRYCL